MEKYFKKICENLFNEVCLISYEKQHYFSLPKNMLYSEDFIELIMILQKFLLTLKKDEDNFNTFLNIMRKKTNKFEHEYYITVFIKNLRVDNENYLKVFNLSSPLFKKFSGYSNNSLDSPMTQDNYSFNLLANPKDNKEVSDNPIPIHERGLLFKEFNNNFKYLFLIKFAMLFKS